MLASPIPLARSLVLAPLLLLGCGDDGGSGDPVDASVAVDSGGGNNPDAANTTVDAMPGAFTLTSTAYAEGAVIPTLHTCHGDDISPQLSWTNPPAGTEAFALVFIDVSPPAFLHSAMWDIPVSRTELPEDVDQVFEPTNVPGAKQPRAWNNVRGYAGPCPGETHNYTFTLHAVDTAELSGLAQNSNRQTVVDAIEAASIGTATLTGSFDPDNP